MAEAGKPTTSPTYPHPDAERFVSKAFAALGKPAVKDDDVLSDPPIGFTSTQDFMGLLDQVNLQIPDTSHLLPLGVILDWQKKGKKVSDVVASVEHAPTTPPKGKGG